jgi:hypothetical protein
MNRTCLLVAATVLVMSAGPGATNAMFAQAAPAAAQPAVPAPQLTPILAGRKITPPLRGEAQVQVVWPPVTKRDKDDVITKIQVKNVSSGPVKGLTIAQPWYNKAGAVSAEPRGVIAGLLQPNEVQIVTIQVTYKPDMISNNYEFTHANGSVKPVKVQRMEAPAPPAKPAAAAKK